MIQHFCSHGNPENEQTLLSVYTYQIQLCGINIVSIYLLYHNLSKKVKNILIFVRIFFQQKSKLESSTVAYETSVMSSGKTESLSFLPK